MSNWIQVVNLSVAVSALTLTALGLPMTVMSRSLDAWTRRFFSLLFFVLLLYTATNLTEQLSYLFFHRTAVTQLLLFLHSLFSSFLMPLLTVYLLRSCGETWRRSPVMNAAMALWLVYLALLILTQFSTGIYYFDLDGQYRRGPWYPVLLLPPVLLMGLNLISLLLRRRRLSRPRFSALLVYLLLPTLAMLIQMRFYGMYFIEFSTAVATIVLFLSILTDQTEEYVRQQGELARQRASILVLQMRPHFICNTLMSVYYLCRQDVRKAQQVILDFTTYLRRNFTALSRAETIPFREELEHARAYLAVEQVRFEGMLFVELDAPHVNFRLPPLTLQPLVENAVKYGVDPELDPLTILVRTRETGDGSELVVEDSGPGPEPADDGSPHIALANLRERLALSCGGSLTIAPRPGGGTVVTVRVPRERAEEDLV